MKVVTATAIRDRILDQRPDELVRVEQTGGGVATLYLGAYDAGGYARVAIGPGRFDWSDPWLSLFYVGDTAVGPDDGGVATPAYPITIAGIVESALEVTP